MRIESDLLGEKKIPKDVYYGIQTLRAYENFPITRYSLNHIFIKSMALTKKASAISNHKYGFLKDNQYEAIVQACDEVANGEFNHSFIVDPIQGGAGTSLNMNANEVIANRANEILGGQLGVYDLVHPNDHVNCAQSTNDVIPTAGKVCVLYLAQELIDTLTGLIDSFDTKAIEFKDIVKMGRTQLQDAVPMTLGQEFHAYKKVLTRDLKRLQATIDSLKYVSLGATAIGTSINADPRYVKDVVQTLSQVTNLNLIQHDDLVDGTQNLDSFSYFSAILKTFALNLSKISSLLTERNVKSSSLSLLLCLNIPLFNVASVGVIFVCSISRILSFSK